jgi:Uma2 family endonuclease
MQTQSRFYTIDEYLAIEATAESRSEYRNGEIILMTGGSIDHNRILGNFLVFLKLALRGKDFEPFMSDLRLWIPQHRLYAYPDLMVIQGKPDFQEPRRDTITNPRLIVEILSKSTQDYDRSAKFRYYRSIPSFQEYLLVNQYAIEIEHYTKLDESSWRFRNHEASTETILLDSLGVELAIADLYEGVDLQNPEESESPNS